MGFTRDIPTPLNIPNTAVKRDNNSEFAVDVIHGDLDGNATSADDGIVEVQGSNGISLVLSNKTITATLDGGGSGGDLAVQSAGTLVGERPAVNFTATSNKVSFLITDDSVNDRVNIGVDIVPANIQHDDLANSGTMTHAEIEEILNQLAPTNALSLNGLALDISATSTIKYTGLLSQSGTATYKPGNGAGATVSYIVRDATFTLRTPSTTTAVNYGDLGTLDLYVNGAQVDTFNLATVFNEGLRSTAQTYPSTAAGTSAGGKIDIVTVDKYNNFNAYQKLVSDFIFAPADFVEGYNTIHVVHNLATDQTSATFEIFYDNDAGADPSINTPTITGLNQTSSKYLSGIRYVSTNDTIQLSVIGSDLFDNVYVASPIAYSSLTGVPNSSITPTDGAVTGLSSPPAKGQTMTVTNKVLTFSSTNVCSNNGRITCTPTDPYGSYTTAQSASQNILVSTYGTSGQSTAIAENFRDENYRLPLSFDHTSTSLTLTGQWTSSAALVNGNAQQYFTATTTHGLVYPTINFTTGYIPAQSGRNYSTFTGNQQYARGFAPSTNKTSITVTLNGVAAGIGSLGTSDLNVEIKLPTQTGWLDAAVAYDSGAGVATDGLGCLNGSISYTGGNAVMSLTFGGKTTGDSGGRMYMRITFRNSTRSISSITTNW